MSSTNKIPLLEYAVNLTEEGHIEIESSLLEKEKWEAAMEELPDYENSLVVSNFLIYLKNISDDLHKEVDSYF